MDTITLNGKQYELYPTGFNCAPYHVRHVDGRHAEYHTLRNVPDPDIVIVLGPHCEQIAAFRDSTKRQVIRIK